MLDLILNTGSLHLLQLGLANPLLSNVSLGEMSCDYTRLRMSVVLRLLSESPWVIKHDSM